MDEVKELAIKKQDFLNSEFGQIVKEAITNLHGMRHQQAENEKLKPWQKAYQVERAAGIAEVIEWFTADVALLEQGYFDKKEDER